MILLIDNYDSFVYNLARYFERLGHSTRVVRNTAIDPEEAESLEPAAIVLSPGPCTPERAGCTLELVGRLYTRVPLLGICLGHQTIAAALGGRVVRAKEPVHGRTSPVHHQGRGAVRGTARSAVGLPLPFAGGRRGFAARLSRSHRPHRRRHGHGHPTPDPARGRFAVPPRVDLDRAWLSVVGGILAIGGPFDAG